ELARILAALADALAFVAIPGPAFFHQILGHSQIDQVTFFGDAFSVNDVELGLAEWRRHLVLHNLDLGAVAGNHFAIFNRRDAADIGTDARIKFQRAAAGGGFRI